MISSETSLTESGSLRCWVCKQEKPRTAYQKAQLRGRGRPWCKECCRDYQLQKKFGLSRAEYERMLRQQGGACAICGSFDPGTNAKGQFCVDHDHATGEVRGLLCNRCNTGLGAFKDDPQSLLNAAAYLEGTMKFTAQFSIPRIDVAAYRNTLDSHLKAAIAQGLMEWLEAVLAEIPVWSGASRATFVKLAQQINYGLPVAPVAVNAAHGLFTERMDRAWMGMAHSDGKLTTDKETGEYTFTYTTTLPWLIWNEYHNANVEPDPTLFYRLIEPGPYSFQVVGARAFLRFAESVDLPAVKPHLRIVRVKS